MPDCQLCAYCGVNIADQVEHVVAKAFFDPVPPDSRLVMVPACRACNADRGDGGSRNMSMDEEYVRTILCANTITCDNVAAASLLSGAISRSFDNSPLFLRRIRRAMEFSEGPEGLQATFGVERDRLDRVVRKIAKGLYFHWTQRILPADVKIFSSVPLDVATTSNYYALAKSRKIVQGRKMGTRGEFKCICGMDDLGANESISLFWFYDKLAFAVATAVPG